MTPWAKPAGACTTPATKSLLQALQRLTQPAQAAALGPSNIHTADAVPGLISARPTLHAVLANALLDAKPATLEASERPTVLLIGQQHGDAPATTARPSYGGGTRTGPRWPARSSCSNTSMCWWYHAPILMPAPWRNSTARPTALTWHTTTCCCKRSAPGPGNPGARLPPQRQARPGRIPRTHPFYPPVPGHCAPRPAGMTPKQPTCRN